MGGEKLEEGRRLIKVDYWIIQDGEEIDEEQFPSFSAALDFIRDEDEWEYTGNQVLLHVTERLRVKKREELYASD